ncbi:MAG TPA: hypothetical protein VFC74_10605 [Oscillospiraceae bacterium]|nr:hypothetical protein [Oscillospiraceae bacterium]
MAQESSLFAKVEEQEVKGEIFQVTHRILHIPREVYLVVLKDHEKPFSEVGAQIFVEEYLKWLGEENGIIGMVRLAEEDGQVILDAAIRYLINPLEGPTCCTE